MAIRRGALAMTAPAVFTLTAWILLVYGSATAAAQTPAQTIDPSHMRLTFDESFKTLSISPWGPGTRWIAHTPWHGDFGSAHFDNPGPNGPFAITPQGLTITATQDSAGHWHAGLICSMDRVSPPQHGFAQEYGYFEMSAKLPDAPGVWPAFWLIGTNRIAEFDVMEYYGRHFPVYNVTAHVWGKHTGSVHLVKVPPGILSSQFNTFGVLITPQLVQTYFNRHLVVSIPTPPEYNTPMYILADLALGGGWPINHLSSPQVMVIKYIRAYALQ
jgi:hypothetical protein